MAYSLGGSDSKTMIDFLFLIGANTNFTAYWRSTILYASFVFRVRVSTMGSNNGWYDFRDDRRFYLCTDSAMILTLSARIMVLYMKEMSP